MMSMSILLALVQNAALLLTLVLVLDLLLPGRAAADRTAAGRARGLATRVLTGVIIGGIGVAIMQTPWVLDAGIFFDTRSVLLAAAGLFFGAVPTGVAMAITAALRLMQGGAGAWTRVGVILASGSLGLAWRSLRPAPAGLSALELYLFGLAVHGVMLALMLTLPDGAGPRVLGHVGLPVLLLYPLATLLLALLLQRRLRDREAAVALAAGAAQARPLTEQVPAILYRADLGALSGTSYVSPSRP